MRNIIISLTIVAVFFIGCKGRTATSQDGQSHEGETTETHASHAGHDHGKEEAHTHEGEACTGHDHDTEEHDHSKEDGHNHDAKDDTGHEHEGEACTGHDHDTKGDDQSKEEGDNHNHDGKACEGHDHSNEKQAEKEHSDEIIFTQEQAAKTNFEVKEIQPASFNQIIKTTGQVLPAPGDETVIVATSNGVISFNSTSLSEGRSVRQSEILFNIASKNIAEGDHYSKVKASFQKAQSEYQRAESLVKDKIISEKEFESIRLDYENAKIAFDAISSNRTSKGVGVTVPMGGFLKNLLVQEGEYVSVGQPLATVSQNKKLVLRADVSEKHYQSLKNIKSANFKTPYDNKVYALPELNGRLLSFGKSSGGSFFIPVTFEFDNRGEVIPGSFTEVFLISSPIENALVVPVSALTNEMGTFYIYIQLDAEGYRKQEVSVGANNGKEIQITKGVKAGDRVVTQGAYQVKMASNSGAIPHGHEH